MSGRAHRMIAERQREISVSMRALQMAQAHHGNRYLSWRAFSDAEQAEWTAKAEAAVPPVSEPKERS